MRIEICAGALVLLSLACNTPPLSSVYLDVFDCYIALPNGYALHTSGADRIQLYRRGEILDPVGTILVSPYNGPYPEDRWRILNSETSGNLTVDELKLLEGREDQESIIVVHNGNQRVGLIGASKQYADAMVASCLANPK